jgi:hypothetical protein
MGVAKGVRGHPRLTDLGAFTCASEKSRQRRIGQRFLAVYTCTTDQEHERNVSDTRPFVHDVCVQGLQCLAIMQIDYALDAGL